MAALLEKKHRDRTGQFLIEGVHLVQEALLAGADVQTVVYNAERGIPSELKNSFKIRIVGSSRQPLASWQNVPGRIHRLRYLAL